MKIKHKLLLFLLLFSVVLLSVLGVNFYASNSSIDLYVKNQTEKLQLSVENSMSLSNELIEATTGDYTYWDEIYEFVSKPDDVAWAENNLMTLVNYPYLDYLWTYNLASETVYKVAKEEYPELENPMPHEYLYQMFDTIENSKKRFTNFTFRTDSQLLVVYGATIHTTADVERLEKPNGFFLLGKIMDTTFIAKLGLITNSNVSVHFDSLEYNNTNPFSIVVKHPLYNFEKKYVATLVFEKNDNFIAQNKILQKKILYTIFVVLLVSIFLLVILFNRVFTKPINSIIESLDRNELSLIHKYINREDEFGKISKLIEAFFNQKIVLENEIEERTQIMAMLSETNEELRTEQERIKELNIKLSLQNTTIEKAHSEIISGINYARIIQQSLLTSKELIDSYITQNFVLYKPKDNVSGDFYYVNKLGDRIVIAAADCTGHGVAGAFLTILGITYLHEVVRNKKMFNPADILSHLRERFKRTFRTFGSGSSNGLDIAICEYNTDTKILQFAGANNPVWIVRNSELIEYKGTISPIGYYPKERNFVNHSINIEHNDTIYLFSDGYKDQQGGDKKDKLKSKIFKNLITSVAQLPLPQQKMELENYFDTWKGNCTQTDDVLILGFRIEHEIK